MGKERSCNDFIEEIELILGDILGNITSVMHSEFFKVIYCK